MSCERCKYFDENEKSGRKGYCSWYKMYVYPDERSCSHYVEASSSSGDCIMTSACCSYLGLPDDCDELTTLRKYRDEYLRSHDGGQEMIDEYYKIAPPIVKQIDSRADKDEIYKGVYEIVIKCVNLINSGENERALEEYQNMILNLKSKYIGG